MKIIFLLINLFSLSVFSQVWVGNTEYFFGGSNVWKDSISTRATSSFVLETGLRTLQVRSKTGQDTLYSNSYRVEKVDRKFYVTGNVYTDSIGAPANTINISTEIGLFYGAGGYPTVTGIEWKLIKTSTAQETFTMNLSDSTWFSSKPPQNIYFRFRELAAQRNHYSLNLHVKKE